MTYVVQKCWRAVGDCAHDVFHRVSKDDPEFASTVGEITPVWSVCLRDRVVADCYSARDARRVADALNGRKK